MVYCILGLNVTIKKELIGPILNYQVSLGIILNRRFCNNHYKDGQIRESKLCYVYSTKNK